MSFIEGEITVEFGGAVGPAGPAGNAVPIAANTVLANPTGSLANPVGVDAAGMRTLLSSVGYVSQTLTSGQQSQVRTNTGTDTLVSVKHYGAVGDGSADDTAEIQAALNSGAKVVFVPATSSRYNITTALTVPAGVRVFGGGEIYQATLGQNALVLNDNCVVDGIKISCPARATNLSTTEVDNGVYVHGKKNVKVINCTFENWLCSGVQVTNSFYCAVSNNTFTGATWDLTNPGSGTNSSDILVYSGTAGGGHIITGNHCLSNNSQGIWYSAIGYDTDVTISNNVCITRNADGTEPAIGTGVGGVGFLNRRHGIITSYGGGASSGRMTISGNVCRRTLVSGIYVASSIALQKGIVVTGNVCSQNGYATASDSTLAGGISINGGASGLVVSSNVIEDFQGVAATGAISVYTRADSETLITANVINNSVRNAIRIYSTSHNVTVSNNSITGTGVYDINLELEPGAKGIRIIDNCIIRKNSSTQSIRYDQFGTGSLVVIRGNRLVGFSNSTSLHVAIFVVHPNEVEVEISENDIRRFQRAVWINGDVTSNRTDKFKVRNNRIDDCTIGFSGTHTNGTIASIQNQFSASVTTKYQPADCGFVETISVSNNGLTVLGTAAPSSRVWRVGDRVVNSIPSVGQPKSWVCTVAGTPGTWVSEGNL